MLDSLSEIRICTGYRYRGELLRFFPPEIRVLDQCQPEYMSIPGWNQKTAGIQEFCRLPQLARDYIQRLSDLVHAEISVVSTGPDRRETIITSPTAKLNSWLSLRG